MSKTILITGGCGFVGSNLSILIKKNYPKYKVLAFDNLKRRGSELNINRLKINNIDFVHGDIRYKEDLEEIGNVDVVIDAAAEPSVLAGLEGCPDYLIHTNFNGTYNALEIARKNKAIFIFLSTSRIYPIQALYDIKISKNKNRFVIEKEQVIKGISINGIAENFPLDGYRSLYGASKLSCELFVQEYHSNFGLNSVINRCGVLTGPYQMGKIDQGVIVLWLARHFWKGKLSYIGHGGKGMQVRDILHIKDLYNLLDFQIHNINKVNGEIFNIGGGNKVSVSLKELTEYCEDITGNKIEIESVIKNRPADIPIYLSDYSKVNKICSWEPQINVHNILEDIYKWIKGNENELKPILG